MIYISSSAYTTPSKEFKISSIYCISDSDSYLITREGGWHILPCPMDLEKLKNITTTQHYSIEPILYSPVRALDGDESAATFLTHAAERLSTLDTDEFNRKLFRVLCEIGSDI